MFQARRFIQPLTQNLQRTSVTVPLATASTIQSRGYKHFWRVTPDEFGLPAHSCPRDIKKLLENPLYRHFDYLDHYWYWRIRKETTVLNPDRLVKLNWKQLAFDLGMPVVNQAMEHQLGLIELYEYLKSAPFLGPFGTIEHPTIVPAVSDMRVLACTGGTGDNEHKDIYWNCREGFLYRCGECDQIFMLVRITYANTWEQEHFYDHKEIFSKDPDVSDVFDIELLENAHKLWNEKHVLRWHMGADAQGMLPMCQDATDYKFAEIDWEGEDPTQGNPLDEPRLKETKVGLNISRGGASQKEIGK